MYEEYKVYGPYLRKDGRKHVIIRKGNKNKTVSYPKYLMECSIGRLLEADETVDHINDDFTDDRLENLQILTRIDNILKSVKRGRTISYHYCLYCNKLFAREKRRVIDAIKQGKKGPYCSRHCAGKENN